MVDLQNILALLCRRKGWKVKVLTFSIYSWVKWPYVKKYRFRKYLLGLQYINL